MLAYHNDLRIKTAILDQLAGHRAADEIVKGQYWQNGKGCAVGCTLHSSDHAEYEARFGIPQMLAKLEDTIFEGLPNAAAKDWPERFMRAARPGANLSLVGWKFQHWLLTDASVNPGIGDDRVSGAVSACAALMETLAEGGTVSEHQARSAESAARSAESAARSAAAWSAAAWSARSAAWSAWSARSARSAAWSAESAESAARSAESAARSAGEGSYSQMADKLVAMMEVA